MLKNAGWYCTVMSDKFPLARRTVLMAAAAVPFLGSAGSASAAGVFLDETSSSVTIGNDAVEVTFGTEHGAIRRLDLPNQGLSLVDPDGRGPSTAWTISFYHPETDSLSAPSYDADLTEIRQSTGEGEASVELTWTDPTLYPDVEEGPTFSGTVTVTVTVREGEPLSYWDVHVANDDDLAIRSVTCPWLMDVQPPAEDGADAIVLPDRLGRRFPNPTEAFGELGESAGIRYPSGFGTMQFTAYTGPDGGLYADARDADGHVKEFRWESSWEDPDALSFRAIHRTPRRPGADVTVPYSMTIGGVDGRWETAADRYREWVLDEGWIDETPPDQPDWLRDLGATYRIETHHPQGTEVSYERAGELVREMRAFLDVPIQFQFGQWQTEPDDEPAESWESFSKTVGTLADAGVRTSSFFGANVINSDAAVFDENPEAMDWVVREPDGSVAWAGEREQSYLIEATHDGWQSYVRDYVDGLLDRGVTEVHYDGFPWVLPACYAADHDHAPGYGGKWFATRGREDVRELQAAMRDADDGLLSGEGICDFYIPFLDVFNSRAVFAEFTTPELREDWIEQIPLFEYTWGDRVVTRNQNHEGLHHAPSVSRLFTGRSILWGALPVFRYADPEADPEVPSLEEPDGVTQHLRRVARARGTYANRFLARGRMLRSPDIDVGTVTLSDRHRGIDFEPDAVVASAWRSDADETGIVMTNVTGGTDDPTAVEVTLALDEQRFEVPPDETVAYVVRNGVYEALDAPGTATVSLTVPPDGVALVVFAPATTGDRLLEALAAIAQVQADEGVDDPPTVARAKRAFEAGSFDEAKTLALDAVGDTGENENGTAAESDSDSPGGESSSGATGDDASGFGVGAALAAFSGAAGAAAGRIRSDDDSEAE